MQKQWPTLTGALSAYLDDFITSGDTYISSIAGEDWRYLSISALTDEEIESWYEEHSGQLDSEDHGRVSDLIDQCRSLIFFFGGFPETDAVMQRIEDFLFKLLFFKDFLRDMDYRFNISGF